MKEYDVSVSIYANYQERVRANSQSEANQLVREKFAHMTPDFAKRVRAEAELFETMVNED